MYTVGQLARICNVSARTLRHYDSIGLFSPAKVDPNTRYRYYGTEQIGELWRVLFLRELGLSLEMIGDLVRDGAVADADHLEAALAGQAERVRAEIGRQTDVLNRLEKTLAGLRREGEASAVAAVVGSPAPVKQIPDLEVVGVRRSVPIREIGGLFAEAGRKLRSRPAGPPFAIYHSPEFDPENCDVEVVFPVAARGEKTLPGGQVAYLVHVGSYDGVGAAYQARWDHVKANGLEPAGPPREVYLAGPESKKSPEEYVTEIQYPVK